METFSIHGVVYLWYAADGLNGPDASNGSTGNPPLLLRLRPDSA